jgi:hypothetical protein
MPKIVKRARAPKPTSKPAPSRFAPSAFLTGTPADVQRLCDDLAELAAGRFSDLTGTSWQRTGSAIASQLRATGHDLVSFEDTPDLQEWQASWHHPRGNFSLLLSFRAPGEVEVTWKSETGTLSARRSGEAFVPSRKV